MNTDRKIIHVDMDQFFAAVEQRDNPELRGKPVAVGFDGPRGVVSTASYEARRFGVHSAQAIATAKRLCPQLIIVMPRFQAYKEVSQQIRSIFHEYTDMVEPLSLDEAFLDVTHNKKGIILGVDIARQIKRRILEETGLTASAGVSYCKFLAKIASDYRKPDGLCVVHPSRALSFIAGLDIKRFWGVGDKTAEKMHHIGIFTGADLQRSSLPRLTEVFGKMGQVFWNFGQGIDDRPVVTEWERKSVSCEQTFLQDIWQEEEVLAALESTIAELVHRIARSGFEGRTLTLKLKYADFHQITRSISGNEILTTAEQLKPLSEELLGETEYSSSHPIRLLGLGVSGRNKASSGGSQDEWLQLELEFEPWPDEMDEVSDS